MWRGVLVTLLLASCSDPPDRPTAPPDPSADDYPALVAWFAQRSVTLPAQPPPGQPPNPAAKAAQESRLLGDGDHSGAVNFWDLFYFWHELTDGWTAEQAWGTRK